ncbi:MAG: PKD domain-containing protein [Bacteroidales bacterium]
MKRNIILISLLVLILKGCAPYEDAKPDIDPAPKAEDLEIIVQTTDDPFRFTFINNSNVKGIANWDLGNGRRAKGDEVTGYYATPDTYIITLTLYTNGGSASITHSLTTTETDYALFDDPFFTVLSGGPEALEGRTWVIDSMRTGHLGVGPADALTPIWWAANPLEKTGRRIYDDEFTFKLVGFRYEIDTKGATHASHPGANAGQAAGYYGEAIQEDEYDQDVVVFDELRGDMTWMAEKDGNTYFIVLDPSSAVLSYDAGGSRTYEVLEWDENFLHVKNIDAEGNGRFHKLIPKGYSDPQISFDLQIAEGDGDNEFVASLANVDIPDGKTITSVTYDFGDGSVPITLTDYTQSVTHTYMRRGNYPVNVSVESSDGVMAESAYANVPNHHPDYEPYLLDMMVVYTDFGETQLVPMGFDEAGAIGNLEIVDNPDPGKYPNRSATVARYYKENSEWGNAEMVLPSGYRFDLADNNTFEVKVYGKAGQQVLMKLENTDRGGNAWQTGTADLIYTIQQDDTWEVARYEMKGVSAGFNWTGDIYTSDVTTDPRFNKDFYNVIRIMLNPGNGSGQHVFHFDDLAGPHVEGLK